MFGLDEQIAHLAGGASLLVVLLVAVLLGLRHATDPDHLTAVVTLMAGGERGSARRAAGLGLVWGAGHATTLVLVGLPVVLFERFLPAGVQQGAEVLVGAVIIALAARLLVRLRRSRVHAHVHDHGDGVRHVHVHVHEAQRAGEHGHGARSRRAFFGIGLLHGAGGSAGVGVLLLAAIPDRGLGVVALLVLAAFTAVSMALASTLFGLALSRGGRAAPRALTPGVGVASLLFGVWYVLGAVQLVPYAF